MDISFTGISGVTTVFEHLSIAFTARHDVQQGNGKKDLEHFSFDDLNGVTYSTSFNKFGLIGLS
jgi:hypothetical protein